MSDKIENAELGWKNAVIMVCSKCGKQFNDLRCEAPERIKSELKTLAKEKCGKDVRVITTSCLNICPENRIAIVRADINDNSVFKAVTVGPDVSAQELFEIILKK